MPTTTRSLDRAYTDAKRRARAAHTTFVVVEGAGGYYSLTAADYYAQDDRDDLQGYIFPNGSEFLPAA